MNLGIRFRKLKAAIRRDHQAVFRVLKCINQTFRYAIEGVKNAKLNSRKRRFSLRLQQKHQDLLKCVSRRTIVRVAFVVTDLSIWKTESVLKKIRSEDDFEAIVVVFPSIYGAPGFAERIENEIVSYCRRQGIECLVGSKVAAGAERAFLDSMDVDIFFLPTAQAGPNDKIYRFIIQTYLTCYVPYHYEITHENDSQTNMYFHNCMWKIFVAHGTSYKVYKRRQAIGAKNVEVTGYPAMEPYVFPVIGRTNAWKAQGHRKKRVIIAPHHTVCNSGNSHSTFLRFSEFFLKLAEDFQESIQFAFKPHPGLRAALVNIAGWSEENVGDYYQFWADRKNCQLNEGEYEDLFLQSDAMIHDCSSFLGEYLFVNRPVMFLSRGPDIPPCFNTVGVETIEATCRGKDESEIIRFLMDLLADVDRGAGDRDFFLRKHAIQLKMNRPSDVIFKSLRSAIFAGWWKRE